MTRIRLYEHPLTPAAAQVAEAASLAEWLLARYEGRPRVNWHVYAGEPSLQTEITADAEAILRGDQGDYVVLENPGDPISILINLAIAAVLNYAVNAVFGPDQRQLDNRSQDSPNNQLSDRQNRVRILERVEDIYGTVRAIPSLLMPTYFKYIEHRKVEYSYLCIGRGYYDIDDVRDGDTPLSEIRGASAAVYAPFTSPNSGTPQLQIGDPIIDVIVSVSRSSSVDGIVLKATNQLQLTAGSLYLMRGPGAASGEIPASTLDIIYQPDNSGARRPNIAAVAEAGQTVTIVTPDGAPVTRDSGADTIDVTVGSRTFSTTGGAPIFHGTVDGTTVTVNGPSTNAGTYTVQSHTDGSVTVVEALPTSDEAALTGITFDLAVDYGGTRTIAEVGNAYMTLTGAAQFDAAPSLVTADVTVDNGLTDWTDWFTVPQTDRTEVWTNVVAQQGMYKDDGAKSGATVAYELQIEQLDALGAPTGVVETVSGSLTGATTSERAETLERMTGWVGSARVRARRTTPFDYDFTGAVIDEIRWMDLYGVTPVTKTHFGNKTTVHTITRTTMGSTAVQRRELNCLASRKLPTYDGTVFSGAFDATGAHVSGTISATSRMVDILAAVSLDPKIGARALTDLDMAQIWATQQALDAWHAEVGTFSYTFDDDSVSYEETVATIVNAAFCAPFRQNGKIRLALDRAQATSAALFTHRNKKPDAETITRKFASDADYDGIELVYMEPDTEKQETIRLPLDGSYTKVKRVEIPGIRSFTQAWYRANREYGRLRHQRISIETETTGDGRVLLPNMRVDIVDNTRFKSFDGEVVGQSGLTLTLSRDVEFLPAEPHSIVLMKRDGALQSIACTAGAAPNQVVLAGAPAETLVTTPTAEEGIRTIFSFAADSARPAQAWLVQEIGTTDGKYVRIRAVNYADDYYAADGDAVPDKAVVIN